MAAIYSQSVLGKYRNRKNLCSAILLLIYFGASWLKWDRINGPNQALLIDLPMRRGYFFGIEIWPEEVFYITTLLILGALGLFIVTAILGRVWCGYTCPHTVFVDLFIKIENLFQGDRNARIRLDEEPITTSKLYKKGATHICWLMLSWSFAFGWVCYYYGSEQLVKDIVHGSVTANGKAWLYGLTIATYLFAGFLREKVCANMCPYGRFQSAMLDNDSLVVTYHAWRGEPRRGMQEEAGDCVNCQRCVVVCPMGIDIRNGLQMTCIGCGLCADACDDVMQKIGKPLHLIAYDSTNTTSAKKTGKKLVYHIIRSKIIFYTIFLLAALLFSGHSLLYKTTFMAIVERERGLLYTLTPDGEIRNTYILSITNKSLVANDLCISLEGLDDYVMRIQHPNISNMDYEKKKCYTAQSNTEEALKVFVKSKKGDMANFEHSIDFIISDAASEELRVNSIFIYGDRS